MSKYKAYAAGGSNNTPPAVLKLMERIALTMHKRGFVLRCSEINQADKAFIAGAQGKWFSFIPERGYDESLDDPKANYVPYSDWAIEADITPSGGEFTHARQLDPGFVMLNNAQKRWTITANSIIYGLDRVSVAKMLIIWSEPGDHCEWYVKAAKKAGVTVYNLANANHRNLFEKLVSETN